MVKGTRKFNKSLSKQVALMDKTGYDILPESGQRKYGVPPPGPAPRFEECQVFVGNIPRDMYEIELVPLFKTAGTIYELWLTVEFSGENRRNAYVTYTKKEEATLAVDMFDHYEVRQRRFLAVCLTVNNCHLLAENIPTEKTREEGNKVTETLQDVTAYPSTTGEKTALSNKELLVEEPIPLKRQKRKEQLPIKEAEEITRSSIEPLSSQDVLSEGSRGTDPLSSSSPTEQFGSTPKWKVKKKVQMLRMGLYRKHSLGHPLLKGFFNYLSKDLSIENCNQEVENVARFLYYMDPTRPSLLFVRDREKVQEYLRKLSEANLTKRTQLNYLKNLKRFLLYQTNNTNLYMKDKPLCIDAKMYVDFIGCLQKQLNKGVSKEIIAVREKFLQENMGLTPYQCNAVLRAAQSDFVAIIKKILDSAPTYAVQLKMSDLVLVLYYLEAIVILKHLQRPGVVQHMTIEEWKNRVRLERDHTAIGVKDHKTAAQQLAAFVLSPEEEAVC
ncbi:uncharacterized protein LOC144192892 isoform X4 [Stigmatopora nigra]